MSAITELMTSMVGDLVVEILVIIGALTVVVGVSILVVCAFRRLRLASQQNARDIVDGW